MELRPPTTVMIDVTPPILSDVLLREVRGLGPELEVRVGRDGWSHRDGYDVAIVSGSPQGVPATLVLCLPDAAHGPVGTLGTLGTGAGDLQVVVDTPLAVLTIIRLFLGLPSA